VLAADGLNVVVYDQFAKPLPVGAGLVIQPVGQDVLARIGALESAVANGSRITRMLGHEADNGRRVLDVWYDRTAGQHYGLAIHRAALFGAIHKAALRAGARIVPNARVTAASSGILTLADGRQEGPFDLIIDASGAKSPLSSLKARPLPYGAIWGTVDWPNETTLQPDMLTQVYRRADRMIGAMPIGTGGLGTTQKAAIFWSLPRDAHESWQVAGLDAWKSEARTLWPDIAPFLDQVTDPAQMTMARYTHGTLRRPYGDRLANIGDAAHRASPQLGQGANMALLDALALRNALRRTEGMAALKLYAKARRWHVRVYQAMSHVFTPQYQSDSRILPILRDRVLFPLSMIPPVPRLLTRLVRGDMLPPLGRLR
jgi:2-polyprenyl-6-methoxyphenol hydroxylase-like FAD-dependent oxidoreductase